MRADTEFIMQQITRKASKQVALWRVTCSAHKLDNTPKSTAVSFEVQ